ncbi:ABC transporter ATP-binding protein [Demequina sp. SYSU T00039]|uniref:ABC transporter ATP-binding protein n=1 Tax=Demequina lignilytica TaxID=3051663 RepID=A0AAW7M2D5_9MICO|nr:MULTISPECIES: ABC transporter ATP-binding protein [unclassified Demequina]MDN4477885.1 ABC transporter ATP-binding protein [Demequina sp. SYSU T00039-1]MDN4487794.1 ABC transporter ATP-binding protein [Demequina sp. SYSU T00039]MDN4490823.1 ABC transporter ATP-binding protein [Demequina sp. SYSU T00068]
MATDPSIETPEAIVVDGLVKRFRFRHVHSLKETVARWVRRATVETDEFTALKDVNLTIRQGETVALLGFNGSGKSTLLKCISGVLTPDEGQIGVRGRIAGLIEVGAGFHPDLTGRENVYLNGAILGMSEAEIEARFEQIVAFSEIEEFIDQEVKFYSSGMFLRLAFSVAVHTDPDVFLVDEILAVGDEPFQRKCLDRIRELRASGKTLVIVSHDLNMVADLCDRGILLEHGVVVMDDEPHAVVRRMRGEG